MHRSPADIERPRRRITAQARQRTSLLGARVGWLRPSVLGANDGIVSTASLGRRRGRGGDAEARSSPDRRAPWRRRDVHGGRRVRLGAPQADTEEATWRSSATSLATDDTSERAESAASTSPEVSSLLAQQVANCLMAHDALGAHARDESWFFDLQRRVPCRPPLLRRRPFSSAAPPAHPRHAARAREHSRGGGRRVVPRLLATLDGSRPALEALGPPSEPCASPSARFHDGAHLWRWRLVRGRRGSLEHAASASTDPRGGRNPVERQTLGALVWSLGACPCSFQPSTLGLLAARPHSPGHRCHSMVTLPHSGNSFTCHQSGIIHEVDCAPLHQTGFVLASTWGAAPMRIEGGRRVHVDDSP